MGGTVQCLKILQDDSSHFHNALEKWRELNLSPAFIKFADKAEPLSASMPLLVHHWREVVDAWFVAVDIADDEALKPLLECVYLVSILSVHPNHSMQPSSTIVA